MNYLVSSSIYSHGFSFLLLRRLSSTQYIRVRVGEHSFYVDEGSENNAVIQNLIIHPQYIHSQNKNDIALIKLTKPVNMNDKHVNTACMPVSSDMSTFYQTSECFATGWGQTQGKFVVCSVYPCRVFIFTPCSSHFQS